MKLTATLRGLARFDHASLIARLRTAIERRRRADALADHPIARTAPADESQKSEIGRQKSEVRDRG